MAKPGHSISSLFSNFRFVLAITMGMLFIGLGSAIVLKWISLPEGDDTMIRLFGGVMILYGIFRMIRIWLDGKNQNLTR